MDKILYFIFSFIIFLSIFFVGSLLRLKPKYIVDGYFEKDGSGTYKTTFSLKKSSFLLNVFQRRSNYVDFSFRLIKSFFQKKQQYLQNIKGLSNITTTFDNERYTFSLSFHFDNIESLNNAIKAMYLMYNQPLMEYVYNDNKFILKNYFLTQQKNIIDNFKKNDNSNVKSFDLDYFLHHFKFVNRYHFSSAVIKTNNPNIKITSDTYKDVLIQQRYRDIDKNNINIIVLA